MTCRNGHDEGRYANGKCKACHRKNARESIKRARSPRAKSYVQKRVPSEPIRRQLVLCFDPEEYQYRAYAGLKRAYQTRFGLVERQAVRDFTQVMSRDTITIGLADRWATFLGLHLDLLFDPADVQVDDEVSA